MSRGGDAIELLVEHAVARHDPGKLAPALAFSRRRLTDSVACMLGGRRATATTAAAAVWSGGQAAMLAARWAVASRALDYCDVMSPGYHPSSTDVPVALACIAALGADPARALAALAVGQDVAVRINRAAQARGFFYRGFDSSLLGLFSGTVTAALLLDMSAVRLRQALGIALSQGLGTFQAIQDKALAVPLMQGFVARTCIDSVLLAQAGATGPHRILDGEMGFFATYAPAPPDHGLLTQALGEHFLGREASCLKAYPSCGVSLALADAALEVGRQAQGVPLAAARVQASGAMMTLIGQPYAPGPHASVDAKFSAQYVVATALSRGRPRIEHFSDDAAREPAALALAQRVQVEHQPAYTHFDRCTLQARLADGRTLQVEAQHGRGWPENPVSDDELRDKLADCIRFTGAGVDPDRLWQQLQQAGAPPLRELAAELGDVLP